jgi:hypothetical protein
MFEQISRRTGPKQNGSQQNVELKLDAIHFLLPTIKPVLNGFVPFGTHGFMHSDFGFRIHLSTFLSKQSP